jgi:hypothetical protein
MQVATCVFYKQISSLILAIPNTPIVRNEHKITNFGLKRDKKRLLDGHVIHRKIDKHDYIFSDYKLQ